MDATYGAAGDRSPRLFSSISSNITAMRSSIEPSSIRCRKHSPTASCSAHAFDVSAMASGTDASVTAEEDPDDPEDPKKPRVDDAGAWSGEGDDRLDA